jgi:dCMP deaminase
VDADIESRYARIVERKSSTDRVNFQDFVLQEEKEISNVDPLKQNLKGCIEMADVCFRNDWTKGELKGKVEKELDKGVEMSDVRCQMSEKHVRPNWDEYFLNIMEMVSKRVTCDRARAGGGGCVVVRDKHILVTGYVGSPPGCAHCDDIGHQFKGMAHEDGTITNHCVRTAHAEQNAICQAAKLGIPLEGATLYCFMAPCYTCAKLIITSGIKRVVASKDYHASKDSKDLFAEAGIKFELLNKEVQQYDKM